MINRNNLHPDLKPVYQKAMRYPIIVFRKFLTDEENEAIKQHGKNYKDIRHEANPKQMEAEVKESTPEPVEDADQTELSAFVEKARESKHPEAILHIYANKSKISEKFVKMLSESKAQGVEIPDDIKRLLAFSCEYVFESIMELLVTDKEEGPTQ